MPQSGTWNPSKHEILVHWCGLSVIRESLAVISQSLRVCVCSSYACRIVVHPRTGTHDCDDICCFYSSIKNRSPCSLSPLPLSLCQWFLSFHSSLSLSVFMNKSIFLVFIFTHSFICTVTHSYFIRFLRFLVFSSPQNRVTDHLHDRTLSDFFTF